MGDQREIYSAAIARARNEADQALTIAKKALEQASGARTTARAALVAGIMSWMLFLAMTYYVTTRF